MLDYEKVRIEKAVACIVNTYRLVLIEDCYDEPDLRQLKASVKLLLKEIDKK